MIPNRWRIGSLGAAGCIAVAAAGCTGTDIFSTPNGVVRIEVTTTGSTIGNFDCLVFELDDVQVRPLDGTCGADSSNAGDPCLNDTDCDPGSGPGTCEGSSASEVVSNNGIQMVAGGATVQGSMLGSPCVPTTTDGANCASPFFPAVPCTQDSDCDLTIQGNFCRPKFLTQATANLFVQPSATVLTAGLFEINRLDIRNVALYRDNPVFLGRCGNTTEVALALGDALRFNLPQDQDKVIRLVLHLDALEQVLTTTNSCVALAAAVAQVISCDTCDAGIP